MSASEGQIGAITQIAELHGRKATCDHPWAGRSLADLLELTEYRRVRRDLTEAELEKWLASRPQVVERWLHWSEDKRTTCGFYVVRSLGRGWQIVSLTSQQATDYETATTAVAAYILRELDYWAAPLEHRCVDPT